MLALWRLFLWTQNECLFINRRLAWQGEASSPAFFLTCEFSMGQEMLGENVQLCEFPSALRHSPGTSLPPELEVSQRLGWRGKRRPQIYELSQPFQSPKSNLEKGRGKSRFWFPQSLPVKLSYCRSSVHLFCCLLNSRGGHSAPHRYEIWPWVFPLQIHISTILYLLMPTVGSL